MKPLLPLLTLVFVASLHAKTEPKPADEALLAAACDSKGGLLIEAPDDDSADESSDDSGGGLFGSSEPAGDKNAAPKKKTPKAPKKADAPKKILHAKNRGTGPNAAADCRKKFGAFASSHGDLKAAIAPEIEGELSQADRARVMTAMTRSHNVMPLGKMDGKSLPELETASRSMFDGAPAGPIKPDQLSKLLDGVEDKLDRHAASEAKKAAQLAAIAAEVHKRDQERQRQQAANQPLSPDLRADAGAQAAVRANAPAAGPYTEPSSNGSARAALQGLNLGALPQSVPTPTSGSNRGSILDDVKAALGNLGVNIMGRSQWGARYGADARAQTPMKITVHHSAGSPSHTDANILSQISGWETLHVGKGFGRMGYHWVINSEGTIVEGQGTELVGSHTLNNNQNNVGICLAGNFDIQQPTDKMLRSLASLMAYVSARYNMDMSNPDFVRGHEFYSRGRICPGVNVMHSLPDIRAKATQLAEQSKTSGGTVIAAVSNG